MMVKNDRVKAVSAAISNLDYDDILAFDRAEPEYDTFTRIINEHGGRDGLYLLGICAGLVDYKLPEGRDAHEFWDTFETVTLETEAPTGSADVIITMEAFLEKPVNSQLTGQKRDRIQRLFQGEFADWFAWNHHAVAPREVWERLADALNNDPDAKTVVFAMKVYDIINLIVEGNYRTFPDDISIPVDFHVRSVASSAGLIQTNKSDDETVRKAWASVTDAVSDEFDRPVSVLRIDSIVWQLGQVIYNSNQPESELVEYLKNKICVDQKAAETLAAEFTVDSSESSDGGEMDEGSTHTADADVTPIAQLDSPDEWHDMVVKVVELWSNDHESIGQTGLVGDTTGRIKFTKWADANLPELNEGSVYRLESVVTDEYRGNLSISANRASSIEPVDTNFEVS